jgi:hypothetical protein
MLMLIVAQAAVAQVSYLQIQGTTSYDIEWSQFTATMHVDRIQNTSSTYTTGTLRLDLWLTETPYGGGSISGYRVASQVIAGSSNGQLGPNQYFQDVTLTGPIQSVPPDGTYFITLTVDEYGVSGCPSSDGFCIDTWSSFPDPAVVGSGGGGSGVYAGTLQNGGSAYGLSDTIGNWITYAIEVPSGATNLTFQISGGSGDADLFAKFGVEPTPYVDFDCVSVLVGNDDSCTIASPAAGTWYVSVYAYQSFSGVTLTASYSAGGGGTGGGQFSIRAGHTGYWYDTTQNGQGLSMEVLTGNQLLATWYVATPDGHLAWVIGLGSYSGSTANLSATWTAGSGLLFPPYFNANATYQEYWGTFTITFTGCDTALFSWSSVIPGYGSGSMNLSRITTPLGLSCS